MSYYRPHAVLRLYDGDRALVTRQVAAAQLRRHPAQITRRCQPVACDATLRVPLYDLDDCAATFGVSLDIYLTAHRSSALAPMCPKAG